MKRSGWPNFLAMSWIFGSLLLFGFLFVLIFNTPQIALPFLILLLLIPISKEDEPSLNARKNLLPWPESSANWLLISCVALVLFAVSISFFLAPDSGPSDLSIALLNSDGQYPRTSDLDQLGIDSSHAFHLRLGSEHQVILRLTSDNYSSVPIGGLALTPNTSIQIGGIGTHSFTIQSNETGMFNVEALNADTSELILEMKVRFVA